MPPADPLARLLAAQPLTHAGFQPYGDLIAPGEQAGTTVNAGTARRFDALTSLDLTGHGGAPCLAIFRTGASAAGPIRLLLLERHRLGSQTFVPLGAGRCLCVVTVGEHDPDEAAICAFVVEPGQGVTLRPGVWHHPLITLGAADVLVIERSAAQVDCEIHQLRGRIMVVTDGDSDAADISKGSNHENR